jgi:hypothetical protein
MLTPNFIQPLAAKPIAVSTVFRVGATCVSCEPNIKRLSCGAFPNVNKHGVLLVDVRIVSC